MILLDRQIKNKIKTNNKADLRSLHANCWKTKMSFVSFSIKMLRTFNVSEGWSRFAAVCPKWRGERNRSNSNSPEISIFTSSLKKVFTRSILLVNDTSKFCTAIFELYRLLKNIFYKFLSSYEMFVFCNKKSSSVLVPRQVRDIIVKSPFFFDETWA